MKQVYWDLDSKESIVRSKSTAALERDRYWKEKKAGGCDLCGRMGRLAFHHVDPSSKDFDIQSAGLRTSTILLDTELEKCVCICVSCYQKVLGGKRPTAPIKDKTLFFKLQTTWGDRVMQYTPNLDKKTKLKPFPKQRKRV